MYWKDNSGIYENGSYFSKAELLQVWKGTDSNFGRNLENPFQIKNKVVI